MKYSNYILLFLVLFVGANCDVIDSLTDNDSSNSPTIIEQQPVELYPVLLDGEWGYINKNGAMVIEPEHQIAYPFSDGLAAVRSGWRWYYMDENGEFVIEGSFQEIRPFSEGKAAIRVDGRWGYINTDGNFIINPRFRSASQFSGERAFVRSLDYSEFHYINEFGLKLDALNMPNDMDFIEENAFDNERALVRDDNLYGYIDPTGNTMIDLQYSEALPFSGNLAAVLISDRWGFIDSSGTIEISPQFISAGLFNDGLAPARKNSNQFGFIDKSGNFVIPEQFDEVRAFSEERAPVRIGEKWTFIDIDGAQIADANFDEVEPFYNGLARITIFVLNEENELEEEFGYINKDGDYVWYPTQ
jgi:hypothetical protein